MKEITDNEIILKCDGGSYTMDCTKQISFLKLDLLGVNFEEYIFNKFGWIGNEMKFSDHHCGECATEWNQTLKGGSCS